MFSFVGVIVALWLAARLLKLGAAFHVGAAVAPGRSLPGCLLRPCGKSLVTIGTPFWVPNLITNTPSLPGASKIKAKIGTRFRDPKPKVFSNNHCSHCTLPCSGELERDAMANES